MQPVLSNSKRMQPVATTSSTQSRRRNAAQKRNATGNGQNEAAALPPRLSDQRVAEDIMAEALRRCKPLLDEVLDPDNDKVRRDQIDHAVTALAHSGRATALPVTLYLIEAGRYDINRPLPAADGGRGP